MSAVHDISAESRRLDGVFREKARAEIAAAEHAGGGAPAVRAHGDELAEVLLLKGEPGPGDIEGGYALAGSDGDAADKALDALGLPSGRFALCTRASGVEADDRAERIRMLIEAVDPSVMIALDPLAAQDLSLAVGMDALVAGTLVTWRGRTVVAIDGLEASLSDDGLKRRVWRQLKALAEADASQT
ncbi:MAG: uracil-DNA glycosylase family protein [Coriobacteriia bacterium]